MDLDFQSNAPPVAPTVQMTEDLENIIIQRIRDKGDRLKLKYKFGYFKDIHTKDNSSPDSFW